MTFSFLIATSETETNKSDENGNKKTKLITHKLKLIDSCRLITASLDTHVNNLSELFEWFRTNKKNQAIELSHDNTHIYSRCKTCDKKSKQTIELLKEKFKYTCTLCNDNISKFLLLLRKEVYPYEYMNTFDKFKETHLPSYESFYSSKTDTNITRQDYKHAQKVWNKFKCKNIGDYHDLYVQLDTLLLADCFENFRNPCQKEYELDPCYFVSIPGLILKKTQVKLELLTDIDMILMNENGIRGGITQAIHRYSSANIKYTENYILNIPSSYLMYLDANNLYGYAMCRKLPLNDFRWVKNIAKLSNEFIMNYDEETSKRGYLLEADIEYPKHLHNEHLELPFCPSKDEKPATNTKYSSSIQKTRKNNEEFLSKPNQKLLTTLYDKERYVVQITTLQQALKHGLKLKKIHRAKSFRHSNWLKPYIDLNTDLRSKAKNEFEKDFFKLMNSSVFGKMMVNVREHRNINLVDTEKKKKRKEVNFTTKLY